MIGGIFIVSLLSLAAVQAQHHGHHLSHEHSEHGSVSFVYDPISRYLVAKTHSSCYYMALDNHQVHQIHQVNGLDQLELHMMASINGQENELSTDVQAQLYQIMEHMCKHHRNLLVSTASTSAPSR